METKGYFHNSQGSKIYYDIERQPILKLTDGQNKYFVLSVGVQIRIPFSYN